MTAIPGFVLPAPRMRFDAAIPSRSASQAYQGVSAHGPFDNSKVPALGDGALLFVFPEVHQGLGHRLAEAWLSGVGNFKGFETMFRTPVATGQALRSLSVSTDLRSPSAAALAYRTAISSWASEPRDQDPRLALVLVPHSEPWQTDRPYYEAKAAFANLGVPSQMVTIELLADKRQFQWSAANIALASFAKLGGVPWTVEAPAEDDDLIIGIGRREVGPEGQRRRIFGYAVTFVSNGMYRQTWSFTPAADQDTYVARLGQCVEAALRADLDTQPRRLVIHLASRTGADEIETVRRAMQRVGITVPVAFLRLDDSTIWDSADVAEDTWVAPKGLVVRLSERRALLHAEELGATGPPEGPLLIALDERSTVGAEHFDELVGQVYRLAHANWRGFNARSKPATLVYGEQLAGLVGHLADVQSWNPDHLSNDLRTRPWFL
jgi:hypothetical protein